MVDYFLDSLFLLISIPAQEKECLSWSQVTFPFALLSFKGSLLLFSFFFMEDNNRRTNFVSHWQTGNKIVSTPDINSLYFRLLWMPEIICWPGAGDTVVTFMYLLEGDLGMTNSGVSGFGTSTVLYFCVPSFLTNIQHGFPGCFCAACVLMNLNGLKLAHCAHDWWTVETEHQR